MVDTELIFSDDARSALGQLRMAGTQAFSAGVVRHRLPNYAIVYVVGGGGEYSDECGYAQAITPGDLLVVFPGVETSYGPRRGRDWSELYIVFDGPVFDLLRDRGLLDRNRPVHRLEPIDHWLGELRSFVERPRPRTSLERDQQICRFLYLLTSMLETSDRPATWLDRAQSLLTSNLGDQVDLNAIAGELGMGYEAFRKRFRRDAGTSPFAYRSTHRLEVARELLASTSMTNREIAASLGYGDEFHFSRRFKQWAGITPRDVRRGRAL